MRLYGRLAGRYPAVAAMVIFALVPYLALSSALQPITPLIAKDLHMSLQAMSLTSGMANAAYAVGTVLAVQLALLLPQRRLMVLYAVLLVIGSVLAAGATGPGMFVTGHVLQGLCTSLLLIAAVPPLVVGYPPARMRSTAMILNVCIFGAVALGPLIGGAAASSHAWRPLFWIIAGIAAGALVLSLLTFEDAPAIDPSAPKDVLALGLAAAGCAAAFFGASELLTHAFIGPLTLVPLIGGLALIVLLFVYQYNRPHPLLCLRSLVSTIPVAGIAVAICAAAGAVSAVALMSTAAATQFAPLHLGLLEFPEFGGAVVTAVLLGLLLRSRGIHYLVLGGMISLGAGILVAEGVIPPTATVVLVASGLIGIGVGSSVAPALFLAGFSLRSNNIQRVFAIIELMRAVAAFMVAPVLLHFAVTVGPTAKTGTSLALWICFGIVAAGTLVGVSLYALGGVRPRAPALERWLGGEAPAWESPPLLASLHGRSLQPVPVDDGAGAAATPDGWRAEVDGRVGEGDGRTAEQGARQR